MDDDAELRRITAHHEAGHAVAAYIRGGTVVSITIEPTAETLGETVLSPMNSTDVAFAIYAGPWAEARARWKLSTFDLDDYYESTLFESMVADAWLLNLHGNGVPSDGDLMQMAMADEEAKGLLIVPQARHAEWNVYLESYWRAIQEVAECLIAGETLAQAEVATIVQRPDVNAAGEG